MRLKFLTGTNAAMFAQALMLIQSIDEAGAGGDLLVCDFGLSEAQRRFLAGRGQLAAIPPLPKPRRHPWYYKSALVDFVGGEVEAVAWLDADMIATRDPRPAVATLLAEMARDGQLVAACPDTAGHDLAGFMRWAEDGGKSCRAFRRLLGQWRIGVEHPYLNSGFFVAASRRWLKDWKKAAFATEVHVLFEQNAFNATAWRTPERVRLLDGREWNVHGDALGRIAIGDGAARMSCDDRPVMLLHATGAATDRARQVDTRRETWLIGERPYAEDVRLFSDPRLSEIQRGLMQRFLDANAAGMRRLLDG